MRVCLECMQFLAWGVCNLSILNWFEVFNCNFLCMIIECVFTWLLSQTVGFLYWQSKELSMKVQDKPLTEQPELRVCTHPELSFCTQQPDALSKSLAFWIRLTICVSLRMHGENLAPRWIRSSWKVEEMIVSIHKPGIVKGFKKKKKAPILLFLDVGLSFSVFQQVVNMCSQYLTCWIQETKIIWYFDGSNLLESDNTRPREG